MTAELVRRKAQEAAKRNKLRGHDKSGQTKRNGASYAAPGFVNGPATKTSAGLNEKIKAFQTPQAARRALANHYIQSGMYTLGRNNELIPTTQNPDQRILVLPKRSKMPRLKIGKAGRKMSKHTHASGIII